MWAPGEHLVIDWGVIAGVHVFCAVLAWSRIRFIRFAADEKQDTTLRLLAECFEVLGGAPAVVLADRMGCLKGAVVANRVVPTPEYVRFATHYRFRPDFCEGADPESKGIVENLVGYGKDDLLAPLLLDHALDHGSEGVTIDQSRVIAMVLADLTAANQRAVGWCMEVNAAVHSEICAVPAERLTRERELLTPLSSLRPSIGPPPVTRTVDTLSTVRVGSARYSVPTVLRGTKVAVLVDGPQVSILDLVTGQVHAQHPLVAPGEASILDEHYGGPRPAPAGPCGPGRLRRNSSAHSGRPRSRSSPVPPRPGTPASGPNWSNSTRWPPPTALTPWSRRCNGPPRSGGGAPRTCAPSSPPAPGPPSRGWPATRWWSTYPSARADP